MKKNNKVYSASDFSGATSSIVVADTWWIVDSIDCTAVGEFSKVPLFELQLKQFKTTSNLELPEGYVDASVEIRRNRTYFVREGRPLYNELATVWEATEDVDAIRSYVQQPSWQKKLFPGHVERLSGVSYNRTTRGGSIVTSSKLEVWYPEDFEEGTIMNDFLFLCNKGVYTPILQEKKDPVAEAISNLDPKIIEAIMALKK